MKHHDKKQWLITHGIISGHPVVTHTGTTMILWQSLQAKTTLASEGKDAKDAIDSMYAVVRNRLYELVKLS